METTENTHHYQVYEEYITAYLTLFTCICLLVLIGGLLRVVLLPETLDVEKISRLFVLSVADFHPESAEKLIYIISTLLFLPLCVFFYLGYRKFLPFLRKPDRFRWLYLALSLFTPLGLICLVWYVMARVDNFYFEVSSFVKQPLRTIIFYAIFMLLAWGAKFISRRWKAAQSLWRVLFLVPILTMLIFLIFERTFSEADPVVPALHFHAYFDSVVQQYLGKVVMVNLNAQYGLYPAFISPVLHLIGATVLNFTLMMSLLSVTSFVCLLIVLYKTLQNKLIVFFAFLTIVFYLRFRAPFSYDPYFQYQPHRFIFPTLFILLGWFYLTSKSPAARKALYYIHFFFGPLAFLWSPDTGLVVLLSWPFLLFLEELFRYRYQGFRGVALNLLRHGVFALIISVAMFLLFTAYLYLLSGKLPDWYGWNSYIVPFYSLGYFAMPIPGLFYPWVLLILCYMVALFRAVRKVVDSSLECVQSESVEEKYRTNKIIIAAVLAVMGVGLFSYYQGRSHNLNLISVSWPALMLVGFFTDDLFIYVKNALSTKPFTIAKAVDGLGNFLLLILASFFLFSSLFSIIDNFPGYMTLVHYRLRMTTTGRTEVLQQQLDFIKANTSATDKVMFFSDNEAVLYLYSGFQRPISVPGWVELMRRSDREMIEDFLANPPPNTRIFWDPKFEQEDLRPTRYGNYHLAGYAPNFSLLLYTP